MTCRSSFESIYYAGTRNLAQAVEAISQEAAKHRLRSLDEIFESNAQDVRDRFERELRDVIREREQGVTA